MSNSDEVRLMTDTTEPRLKVISKEVCPKCGQNDKLVKNNDTMEYYCFRCNYRFK